MGCAFGKEDQDSGDRRWKRSRATATVNLSDGRSGKTFRIQGELGLRDGIHANGDGGGGRAVDGVAGGRLAL